MFYRFEKFLITSAYLLLFWFTGSAVFSFGSASFFQSCAMLSAGWLILTGVSYRHLLLTYADRTSRLRLAVPTVIGLALSILAAASGEGTLQVAGAVEVFLWAVIFLMQEKTRSKFYTKGFGLMPKNAWVNPPAEALREGDVILTSGRMAARTRNTVGHMELVLKRETPGGKTQYIAFSAYMEKGVVIHTLRALCKTEAKASHYIALRPRTPLTDEQNREAVRIADEMKEINKQWTESETIRRTALIDKWLPASLATRALVGKPAGALRSWLLSKYLPTGYDWLGMYTGKRNQKRWTCMGACLEVLDRVGVKTLPHGTGLLGLGTGLLNPLMPIRFLTEPSYRLLTDEDEKGFAATQPASQVASQATAPAKS